MSAPLRSVNNRGTLSDYQNFRKITEEYSRLLVAYVNEHINLPRYNFIVQFLNSLFPPFLLLGVFCFGVAGSLTPRVTQWLLIGFVLYVVVSRVIVALVSLRIDQVTHEGNMHLRKLLPNEIELMRTLAKKEYDDE